MTAGWRNIIAKMAALPLPLSGLVISPAAQAQGVLKVGSCPSETGT
jgi:hypothetical protein